MVVSESEDKAIGTLREICESLTEIKRKKADDFVFFNKMKSPIKRMQNKYRYQVLMRILPDKQELKSKIYSAALAFSGREVSVYVEENPNNLN